MSHFDEVFLMFKFSSLNDLAIKTEEDVLVSQKLVSMWTNFAKTGKPTEGDIHGKADIHIYDYSLQMTHGNQ